jgi:hypothetical protein
MNMKAAASAARRNDLECQCSAGAFLTELIGAAPDDLRWDDTHHLQGHAHCGGREIVVIAARDTIHHAVVLTAEDWDAVRIATPDERAAILRDRAIDSHRRLIQTLAAA